MPGASPTPMPPSRRSPPACALAAFALASSSPPAAARRAGSTAPSTPGRPPGHQRARVDQLSLAQASVRPLPRFLVPGWGHPDEKDPGNGTPEYKPCFRASSAVVPSAVLTGKQPGDRAAWSDQARRRHARGERARKHVTSIFANLWLTPLAQRQPRCSRCCDSLSHRSPMNDGRAGRIDPAGFRPARSPRPRARLGIFGADAMSFRVAAGLLS